MHTYIRGLEMCSIEHVTKAVAAQMQAVEQTTREGEDGGGVSVGLSCHDYFPLLFLFYDLVLLPPFPPFTCPFSRS
jgi:hypothetical protein